MIAFADLLGRLAFATEPAARIAWLRRYFETQLDPERGDALGILTRALRVPTVRPGFLRTLAIERCDAALFDWSHDFVGDLTETVALIWPQARGNAPPPLVSEVVRTPRAELPVALGGWLDACDAGERLVLLKLLTGGFRSLVKGAEIRIALAGLGGVPVAAVEEVWHGSTPPYTPLFAWLEGRGPRPASGGFLPFMLPGQGAAGRDWLAETLWEGDRVLVADGRVFSRHADDVSTTYPDWCVPGVVLDGVVTGEPLRLRLVDMLRDGTEDLRTYGFTIRRARLEAWFLRTHRDGMALSPVVAFGPGDTALMLKRADSPYVAGTGHHFWLARPRPLRTIAAVLLYAEAGLYTVGLWRDGILMPIGQAVADDTASLEAWVRNHTMARYGPVREVEKTLIVSVTFVSVRTAARRKAGVFVEGARIVGLSAGATADDLDVLGGGR